MKLVSAIAKLVAMIVACVIFCPRGAWREFKFWWPRAAKIVSGMAQIAIGGVCGVVFVLMLIGAPKQANKTVKGDPFSEVVLGIPAK